MLVRTPLSLLSQSTDRLRIPAVIRRAHAQAEQATRRSLEAMISAGEKLIEAKSLLDHGQCGPWLKEHCRIPRRTISCYMDLARNRSILDQAIQNGSAANLSLRTAQALHSGVAGTYNAHAYAEERAAHVEVVVNGGHQSNVMALPARA
jgi:hypothetical protein